MKVYHLVYEPSFKSVDIHFWTRCPLACRSCYTRYETLDFGLFDDPIAHIASRSPEPPPERFLSLDQVMSLLKGRDIDRAIFMGTEAALDPEMPALARALHERFQAYNVMLTNGFKLAYMSDIDELIFSLKAVTPALHSEYTGKDNAVILENFASIVRSGKKMQAETVLIPGLIEADEIEKIARFISGIDRNITLRIDAYFPAGKNPWRAATAPEVEEAARLARTHLNKVSCLALDMKRTGDKPLRLF
jgi:pyruvate-formate lyase-activating enzyme